ncbi:hypothetical protein [Streptomyces sp. NBC_01207]|uniref:hypothetical protein n=1 Tax=Streptomyces sp. NBC_01207 TaxID=2903772 RepID=UPI002E15637A|nr:hypothetical protein OG457_00640 [Streptomyces sp. NBC_01207]
MADEVAAEITPDNTVDTYAKSWRVWTRFCRAVGLHEPEGSRGALLTFVAWMLREGQQNGEGYAPGSAATHLAAVVVGLRERGFSVSGDDRAEARKSLTGLEVKLLQAGERRGRRQAVGADIDGLAAIARSCPDTLAGDRDKALLLTGFHYASRPQDPAGLQCGDVTLHPRGLVVAVLTGKTKHSVRDAKIGYAQDPEICPVRAHTDYREHLVAGQGWHWASSILIAAPGSSAAARWPGPKLLAGIRRQVQHVGARSAQARRRRSSGGRRSPPSISASGMEESPRSRGCSLRLPHGNGTPGVTREEPGAGPRPAPLWCCRSSHPHQGVQ